MFTFFLSRCLQTLMFYKEQKPPEGKVHCAQLPTFLCDRDHSICHHSKEIMKTTMLHINDNLLLVYINIWFSAGVPLFKWFLREQMKKIETTLSFDFQSYSTFASLYQPRIDIVIFFGTLKNTSSHALCIT